MDGNQCFFVVTHPTSLFRRDCDVYKCAKRYRLEQLSEYSLVSSFLFNDVLSYAGKDLKGLHTILNHSDRLIAYGGRRVESKLFRPAICSAKLFLKSFGILFEVYFGKGWQVVTGKMYATRLTFTNNNLLVPTMEYRFTTVRR